MRDSSDGQVLPVHSAFTWIDLLPLAQGALLTLALCVVAGVVGTILGLILAVAQNCPLRVLRWLGRLYVTVVRGIPLLVIVFFVYFGIPLLFPSISLNGFVTAAFALTGFATAYMAEIFRGSIEAVPVGQTEASAALGLGYFRRLLYVIFPQMLKIAVPPGIGFLIALVKDSSLVTVIGFVELTSAGNIVSNLTGNPIVTYLVVAAFYFVICYAISSLGRWYESRTGVKTKVGELINA